MFGRRNRVSDEYPEDIFDNSRMSFGDHIEQLRSRLLKALYGLAFCLMIGFVLDYAGKQLGYENFGIGIPMMKVITDPVESQVRAFYENRNRKATEKLIDIDANRTSDDDAEAIQKKLKANDGDISTLTEEERKKLLAYPVTMPLVFSSRELRDKLGIETKDGKDVTLNTKVYPAAVSSFSDRGQTLLQTRKYLTTLSAQEAFMVYFKVSLLCGAVLASPWIFYHIWAFVSAGMYPHEKKYIHLFLPVSVILFLAGILLCQFWVMPGAVKALLGFNNWIDLDPDLRLNEWLGFALVLPLVFGLSFQTPLVMFFLSRVRLFTYKTYLSKWRIALFILAVMAAILTPTPDIVTMAYLFVPMFGLYLVGILVCYWFPAPAPIEEDEMQVAV